MFCFCIIWSPQDISYIQGTDANHMKPQKNGYFNIAPIEYLLYKLLHVKYQCSSVLELNILEVDWVNRYSNSI